MPTFARIDARSAQVSQYLRTARQIILKSLPRPTERAVLKVLANLEAAYQALPLHRLTIAANIIKTAPTQKQAESLRNVYVQLDGVLEDLGHETKPTVVPDDAVAAFLKAISAKGWKIQEITEKPKAETDGFKQSQDYIDKIAIEPEKLLNDRLGIVELPIILLQGYAIPKQSLNDWSQEPYNLDIAVVFGRYITLSPVTCIGIEKKLVEVHKNKETYIDMTKFFRAARELGTELPIPCPKLFHGHYYCPVWSSGDEARKFFRQWDLLLR